MHHPEPSTNANAGLAGKVTVWALWPYQKITPEALELP